MIEEWKALSYWKMYACVRACVYELQHLNELPLFLIYFSIPYE